MLDVRPVAFLVPVAEQDFASLTPIVQIVNSGTVPALITGHAHIYRESTGLKLYTSELRITTLAAGATADVAALTPWSPPAPADDDYFIMCDVTATATVPHQPPGAITILGPYTFDIKPVGMGPAPAAHAVTHQDAGSDEIDVTGLSGVLADDQVPDIHSNTKHNPVMEEAANKGLAGGYCGLPDPLNSTLPLRADGTAARPEGLFVSLDFLASSYHPWAAAALNTGSIGANTSNANHPGIRLVSSSTTPNSGASVLFGVSAIRLAGSEKTVSILRPLTLAGTTIRAGYLDATSSADAVDGCYLEMAQVAGVDGTLVGKTANNSTRSTTGTSFLLVTNTWYRFRIIVDPTAARVDFYLYSEAGALLWTDNLTTNIPTSAGRETSHGIVVTNSGSSAVTLADLDYIDCEVARTLIR